MLGSGPAWVQVESNQFEPALASALKALERSSQDRYVWNAFVRAGFSVEKFDLVLDKLGQAFPGATLPDWGKLMQAEARQLQIAWQAELAQRQKDRTTDDLPRVRLVIEHRKFVFDNGKPTSKIESKPAGEVILELFEDRRPTPWPTFLSLLRRSFTMGPSFSWPSPRHWSPAAAP